MFRWYQLILVQLTFLCANLNAQNFANPDLNGSVNFVSVPTSWVQIPDTDPICQANTPPEATVDILDATGPNAVGGVAGIPFSGNTFCSGLHSSDNGSFLWHEGIMQTVGGFTIGNVYDISFYQSVVKQQNAIDPSGSWRVYMDGVLLATTAVSNSPLAFDDVNLIWDCRTIQFTATSVNHLFQFIPWDDDADLTNSPGAANGALRMGIDLITIVPGLDPSITPVQPVCVSQASFNFTAVDPGGTWSGTGIINTATGEFDPSVAGIGIHEIVYQIPAGCSFVSDTFDVEVINAPDPYWTDPSVLCVNDNPINLDTYVNGTAGGIWSGIGVNGNMFDPSSGTSNVTYTVGNAQCSADSTIQIQVNPSDDAGFSYAQTNYCVNDPNPIALITGLAGGTFIIDNGGNIDSNTGEIDLLASGPGSYDVSYLTNGPCPSVSTVTIVIETDQSFVITQAGPYCENDGTAQMLVDLVGGVWSATCGTCIDAAGQFNPSQAGQGSHTIYYSVGASCVSIDSIEVEVNGTPIAGFTAAIASFESSNQIEFSNTSTGATSYSWDFGDGTGSVEENPIHLFQNGNGDYQVCLTVTNDFSCIDQFCSTVSIEEPFYLYLPNAVTANGDGLNDEFYPVINGDVSMFEMFIFDRWGQRVYYSESPFDRWDVKDKSGNAIKSDIYVWKIRLMVSGEIEIREYYGHVTVVR